VIRLGNLLIIALAQYLTAIFLAGQYPKWTEYLYDFKLLLLACASMLIAAAGYIINDYYDVKIDYINKPGKVVVGKLLDRRIAMAIHPLLNLAGVTIGFYLSLIIGAINFMCAILLWWYSNHLQRLPFIGNLCRFIRRADQVFGYKS